MKTKQKAFDLLCKSSNFSLFGSRRVRAIYKGVGYKYKSLMKVKIELAQQLNQESVPVHEIHSAYPQPS